MSHLIAVAAAVVALSTLPVVSCAESSPSPSPHWEFVMSSGALLPTGAHREAITRGALSTAQLTRVVRPSFAVNATFGWARSRDRAFAGDSKVDVLTYDAGAELRARRMGLGRGITLRPFAGIGIGARSYDYRHIDRDTAHGLAAYGSVGGELGAGSVRLRLEARDNLAGFSLTDGPGEDRLHQDVALMAGLRFVGR